MNIAIKVILFVSVVFTFGCKHTADVSKSTTLVPAFNSAEHIVSNCKVYNLDLMLIHFVDAQNCIFEDDGSLVFQNKGKLTKTTASESVTWSIENKNYSFISKSTQGSDYLAVSNETAKNVFSKQLVDYISNRVLNKIYKDPIFFNALEILDKNGVVKKRYNFLNHFKKNPHRLNNYYFTKNSGAATYNVMNISSFYELYDNLHSEPKLRGYVAYDRMNQTAYILNADLNTVEKEINFAGRITHELKQWTDQKLIFYRNPSFNNVGKIQPGAIEYFDLQLNEFGTLMNKSKNFSNYCSSVQVLNKDLLFIFHSTCGITANLNERIYVFEYYNIKNDRIEEFQYYGLDILPTANILNLKPFFEARNNNKP